MRYLVLAFLCAIAIIAYVQRVGLNSASQPIQRDLTLRTDEFGAIGSVFLIGYAALQLPAGWLADRWSRRNMMALFYFGCGVSLLGAALAPNLVTLAIALAALGMFAAIYHPVGTAMLIEQATVRGRSLAFNGVCGNLGVAFAAGITAVLASLIGWRGAFIVPALICVLTGFAYLRFVADDRHKSTKREKTPDARAL